jgi:hypothetical protein
MNEIKKLYDQFDHLLYKVTKKEPARCINYDRTGSFCYG